MPLDKRSLLHLEGAGRPRVARRLAQVAWVVGALFGLVVARLAYLQLVRGSYYAEQARLNSIRLVPRRANRGLVLTRNGTVLAKNVPAYSVLVIPSECRDVTAMAERLGSLLSIDPAVIADKIEEQRQYRGFEPVRIRDDLDRTLAAAVEERRPELPGVIVQEEPRRFYVFGNFLAHVLGYVGEVTQEELASLRRDGYSAGDVVGKAGVEKVYEKDLRGRSGGMEVRVNARGQHLGVIDEREPVPGSDLVLAIDEDLQRATEEALEETSTWSGSTGGAAVAIDPQTGEVLAMASKPDYNPNDLSTGLTVADWKRMQSSGSFPMLSRAHQGKYPPGSTFKIVTATACLEEKVLTRDTAFDCGGIYWIKTWPYKCWHINGHGWSSIQRALVHSCDIFFYQAGLRLTVRPLAAWAVKFGLGSKTGIDLPGESAGFVPSPEWKEKLFHLPWFPGNTVQFSIGQSYLLATPLQMAQAIAAVSNGGVLYRPHVVKELRPPGGTPIPIAPEAIGRVPIAADTLDLIRTSLWGVVNIPGGTGWRARLLPRLEVAGKTGTAQNAQGKLDAWFLCYAPFKDPKIAVAVVLENTGEGNVYAAPIAKRMLETYFRLPVAKERPLPPPPPEEGRTGD